MFPARRAGRGAADTGRGRGFPVHACVCDQAHPPRNQFPAPQLQRPAAGNPPAHRHADSHLSRRNNRPRRRLGAPGVPRAAYGRVLGPRHRVWLQRGAQRRVGAVMESVDTVVIGAGVVGLAVARALAQRGREVLILEAATAIGTGTSSRNSEVIHAGLYYPSGSLKALLCVQGRERLYAYCAERGIGHRRCGKLIAATDESQLPALRALQAQALANGVDDVQWLTGDQARALEPQLHAVAGLLSPSTGIVDSHALMLSLLGDAEAAGALLALASPVLSARVGSEGIALQVGGEQPMALLARCVVNAAGHGAPALAARIEGLAAQHVPRAFACKGHYFSLRGRSPFSRLVYPMHNSAGLGVHLTLDLGGQARFGPDTEWLDDTDPDTFDYRVDESRIPAFEAAIRRYWPALPDGALTPAYSGIRPKISGPREPAADFRIDAAAQHGVPGLVNLFGIESPGLTACLALAEHVAQRL